MDKRPIGMFDSGVGGLSVLKELVKLMPRENYIFVADQINVPYGQKTQKELKKITLRICDFLVSKNSKLVVVACNTATCYALEFLRTRIKTPIVGTVPAVKPAAEKSRSGIIGIMSTPATSKSKYLKKLIRGYASNMKIVNVGCPDLENMIEAGDIVSPKASELIARYTRSIKKSGADIIVLGCTHYPFLKLQIKQAVGRNIKLVDSGRAIAKHSKETLRQMGILNGHGGRVDLYTTGSSSQLSKVASHLLKRSVEAKHISL